MKEDDLANQITPCCHIKQLNERITESEKGCGVDSFFISGDITFDMVLPLLMRRRIVSTLTVCLQGLDDDGIKCLAYMMKDKLFIDNKWVYTIQHLNIVFGFVSDLFVNKQSVLKHLEKYKERITIARSDNELNVVAFSDQKYDHNPLALVGVLPCTRNERIKLQLLHLFTKKETADPIINRLLSIVRVHKVKDFWEPKDTPSESENSAPPVISNECEKS